MHLHMHAHVHIKESPFCLVALTVPEAAGEGELWDLLL